MNKSEKPYKPLDRWDEICYKFKAFDHSYVKNFRSIEYINKDIEGKSSAEVVNILHQKKAEYDFFLRVIEYIHKGYSKRISLSQYYHYYKQNMLELLKNVFSRINFFNKKINASN